MNIDIKPYNSWEHASLTISKTDCLEHATIINKPFGKRKEPFCFKKSDLDDAIKIDIGYYIGVDWLIKNRSSIIVAPKLNTRLEDLLQADKDDIELDVKETDQSQEGSIIDIDYFAMLKKCLDTDYLHKEIDELVQIDWQSQEVPISQNQDWLSPLLIVKFLNVLKSIIRKGLKKSYYQVTQNLNSKIKGKILVGRNIKQNLLKNRLTHIICQFEEFGIDSVENRLLKKAMRFSVSYLDNHRTLFGKESTHFTDLINFCRPAFESISNEVSLNDVKHYKPNPFFKEYIEGIHLAKLILKRYAYTISNTVKETVTTPPYWIDMPKLFELYAYHFLKTLLPKSEEVTYHVRTYGNELDFLINSGKTKMVADAKYKPIYLYGKDHKDIRQVSGYSRLEKVYTELKIEDDRMIDCLIIYPDVKSGCEENSLTIKHLTQQAVTGYRKVYKVGIKLPVKPVLPDVPKGIQKSR